MFSEVPLVREGGGRVPPDQGYQKTLCFIMVSEVPLVGHPFRPTRPKRYKTNGFEVPLVPRDQGYHQTLIFVRFGVFRSGLKSNEIWARKTLRWQPARPPHLLLGLATARDRDDKSSKMLAQCDVQPEWHSIR